MKHISDSFEKDELKIAFHGQDAVVNTLSHAANTHQRTIMHAAAEAGVRHFVANHWGSNAELPIIRESSTRSEALDQDIDYVREQKFANMCWTAIVPGIFFDL